MPLGKMAREQLEAELLLSKGGGIYYDNARVEAIETEATLFIGLGGTGADMLIRIKNEVKRRMVLPQISGKIVSDTPKNIAFLAMDTDKNATKKTWGTATFDQYGAEFCSLAVDDIPAMITQWKAKAEKNIEEASWYDGVDGVQGLPGAGGIRQVGRLMLFENIKTVYRRIQEKISDIISIGIKDVTVVVVTGIAGGTGSGTFLDVAYLARSALEKLDVSRKKVFGYIVMPDVNVKRGGNEIDLWRNGFASLKELDYWMSPGENEQKAQYVQKYSNDVYVRSIASTPFDFCHLLSAQDMEGLPLDYDKVIGSMAENVFAYIAGEVGQQSTGSGGSMSSMYSNINGYITTLTSNSPIPACYRYLAVGSHKLEIPYEEISTLLAIRLFERLRPTLDLRPTDKTFKEDMRHMNLVPTDVIHNSLTHDVPASPLDGNPNYQYGQIWGGENNGPKSNRAYADVYQWSAREYQPTATKNAANWVSVQNGIFRNFVSSSMKNPNRGPQYLAALIKSDNEWSIVPTLERMATLCDGVAATSSGQQAEIESKLLSAYNAGQGKMLNKHKYVADYLSALREWKDNDAAMWIYPKRAEAIRALSAKLLVYYDKVFSKLSDVMDALPEIFRQNYDYIAIAQREAEQEGKLDDTRLIWPLKYERERQAEFNKMLDEGIVGFLDDLNENLGKWTGCDLDSLDATSADADVPGFISRFISEQFGALLTINMEDIMKSKEGADNLDNYLRRNLVNLKDKSVPMFSMNAVYRNTSTADFGIASVPEDCREILSSAKRYLKSDRIEVKESREKTRLYFVKVVSGIPLYAYSKIEDAEKVYEEAKTKPNGQGMHLNKRWRDDYPTPLPEAAWTPTVYENPTVKTYNDSVRAAFDFCVKNDVIRPDSDESPTKLILYIADPAKADASELDFGEDMSLEERLAALRDERGSLWSGDSVDLKGMSTYGGDTKILGNLIENVRESTLRIPRLCAEIKRQADIVNGFAKQEKELEDPRYFASALICGLVAKQGFKIVLKRSIDSASSDMLYDITLEKPFGEHEAYVAFRKKLDDRRREEIDQIRGEVLDRVAAGGPEKARVVERVSAIASAYAAELQKVKGRIERTAIAKRRPLNDVYAFYSSVLNIAETFRDKYLAM